MKVLITGVAGFIGSNLSERLLQSGIKVLGIDNFDPYYDRTIKERNLEKSKTYNTFTLIEGDILNINKLLDVKEKIDLVIHLAAKVSVLPSLKNPQAYIKTNIQGTQAVLEYMRHNKIKKIIFASSSSIYGNNKKIPFSERDAVDHPISPYAYTKKTGELMLHTYHHLYDFDVIAFRFFTVYGPRQRPDLAIHKFIRLINQQKVITMYGKGDSARDYTYITDILDGLVAGIQYIRKHEQLYEIINLGNSQPIQLKDMISTIVGSFHEKIMIQELEMQPGDVNITYASIEKAQQLLGYQPKVSFKEGIDHFVNWSKF